MSGGSSERYWAGVDLGGTKMLAVIYDDKFNALGRERKRTRGHEGAARGLERIAKAIRQAAEKAEIDPSQIAGIGIGAPGPVNLEKGTIIEAPNLGWENIKVQKVLSKEMDCPVSLLNDVDAGVYGEYRFGAGKDARCVVGAFMGTGIGGGCVYDGLVFRGKNRSCMEIGHMPVVENGPLCGCGRRGCLEAVASRLAIASAVAAAASRGDAPHLLAETGTDMQDIRSAALAASVANGDVAVREIIENAGNAMGRVLAGIVNLMAPDRIVLGGGLVEAMPDLICKAVSESAAKLVMPSAVGTYDIVPAELGDDSSVLGAAAWGQKLDEGH